MATTAQSAPHLSLEVQQVPKPCRAPRLTLSPGQIARMLDELVALGFIEKVKDGFGVTRYKPTNGRIVR